MFGWFRVDRMLFKALDLIAMKDAELAAERAARAIYAQRLAELKLDHAHEIAELQRRLAIAQANFEWLTVSHNQVSLERAQLASARYRVDIPSPEIHVNAPATGVPSIETGPRSWRDDRLPESGDLSAQGVTFEDMGENAARAQGVVTPTYSGLDTL